MVKYYKLIYYIVAMIILSSCTVDFTKKTTEEKEIYGKIIEKYRDEWNHGEPTVIYENKDGQFKYQISDWSLKNDLWDFLQTNDSISKPSGSLVLRVIKPDGTYRDYEYQR